MLRGSTALLRLAAALNEASAKSSIAITGRGGLLHTARAVTCTSVGGAAASSLGTLEVQHRCFAASGGRDDEPRDENEYGAYSVLQGGIL